MRKWLLSGILCALVSCLPGCSASLQTPISRLTTPISPVLTSPLTAPTATIPQKVAVLWLTAQAQPTLEPTPAIPADGRPCLAADLTLGEGSMGGATQHDFVYLPMANTSHIGCVLQPPVKVQLVDAQGKTLPVGYSPPLENARSPTGEPLKLYIRPDEVAMFILDWGNWCSIPLMHPYLIARVNLYGDNASLNIPLDFPAGFPFSMVIASLQMLARLSL
jgi:hypothetical protein